MKKKNLFVRFVSTLLIMVMVVGLLPSFTIKAEALSKSLPFDENLGVYTISTPQDYQTFVDDMSTYKWGMAYDGSTVVLTNDIDLSNLDLSKLSTSNSFYGNFDGQGHTLYNFKGNQCSLFGATAVGTIKNFNLKINVEIEDCPWKVYAPVAINHQGTMEGVSVTGNITVNVDTLVKEGLYKISGMVGTMAFNGNIKNCYSSVNFHCKGDKDKYLTNDSKEVNFYGIESTNTSKVGISNTYFNGNFNEVYNKATEGEDAYKNSIISTCGGASGEVIYDCTVAPNVSNTSSDTMKLVSKTTEEMKKKETYGGWNEKIWNIQDGEYPTIKIPTGDITELKVQINKAESLKKENYTEASWEVMMAVVEEAKTFNETTSQYLINIYEKKLSNSIENLVESVLNKKELSEVYNEAKNLDAYLYTEWTMKQVTRAADNAKLILDGDNYNQKSIDEAIERLRTAISNLVTVKSLLLKSIEEAKGIDQSQYADYSNVILTEAINRAEGYYNDINLTEELYRKSSRELSDAIRNMDKKPSLTKNENGQFTINNAEDLIKLSKDTNEGECGYRGQTIVFTTDIDMEGKVVGGNDNSSVKLYAVIDGKKHNIKNYEDKTSAIFPATKGKIKNLSVDINIKYEQANEEEDILNTYGVITNSNDNSAVIENCSVSGDFVVNTDKLEESRFKISAFGGKTNLLNCYSRVNFKQVGDKEKYINSKYQKLQLFGLNLGGKDTSNCYYAGKYEVYNKDEDKDEIIPVGEGIVYYDKNLVPNVSNDVDSSLGKTTKEMKNEKTYDGWDFKNVWNIKKDVNDGYPTLHQADVIALDVKPVLEEKIYDGTKDAKVKKVIFDNVDEETQKLIDKYNVKVVYEVESASYGEALGVCPVDIKFKKIDLTYDENSEICFSIKSVLEITGAIKEKDASSVKGDTTLNWGFKLGNMELTGVSDAKTPRTGEEMKEMWKFSTSPYNAGEIGATMDDWENVPGTPIVVGDYTYCYISNKLWKIKTKTGDRVASADCPGAARFFIYSIYGDGKIFVPRNIDVNGKTQYFYIAYDADTLEQLYYVDAELLTYYKGNLYGNYADYSHDGEGKASFVQYSTEDKDTSSSTERIEPVRVYKNSDKTELKISYPVMNGDYAIATDDKKLQALNLVTGEVTKSNAVLKEKDVSGQLNFYEKNSRVYIATKTNGGNQGSVYSIVFNKANGTFDNRSVKSFDSSYDCGSNSIPIIYNDRIYLCGGGHFMGGGDPFRVLDANTLEEIYKIDDISSKASVMLTTAYATKENNQTVYMYVVPYGPEKNVGSSMYIIKDSIGQTKPDFEWIHNVGVEQYASQSVCISKDGDLVWYNDAKYLYCYGMKNQEDTVINSEDIMRQIDRMPAIEDYEYYNIYEASRIKERYNNLSEEEKAKVTNIAKLNAFLENNSSNPVENLISGIDTLPELDKITLDHAGKVSSLVTIYKNLNDEDKAKVTNSEKLFAAEKKIVELQNEKIVGKIKEDIEKLPIVEEITKKDKGDIVALRARVDKLSEEVRALVTNESKLIEIEKRIVEVEEGIEALDKLIVEKLRDVDVTLDTRDIIKEIDKASEGLPKVDVYALENYEYYVSSAKAKIASLLIENYLLKDGKEVEVNNENAKELKGIIEEIQYYYDGIKEEDRRYVKNYGSVSKVLEKINEVLPGEVDDLIKNEEEKLPGKQEIPSSDNSSNKENVEENKDNKDKSKNKEKETKIKGLFLPKTGGAIPMAEVGAIIALIGLGGFASKRKIK